MTGVDLVLSDALDWMREGTCAQVDPDLWHPAKGASPKAAQRICRTECPVVARCLEYALASGEEHGVWGGTTNRERQKIRRARKLQEDLLRAAATEQGAAA